MYRNELISLTFLNLDYKAYYEAFIIKEMFLKANICIIPSQYQCLMQDLGGPSLYH